MYRNIGLAIDRALGNITPVYEAELDAKERGNLAIYAAKVRACIEKFSIGMIIFDEIQHINFHAKTENSFETILELTNQTKCAFAVVGTEDAYGELFSGNLRQSRRLGTEIRADRYCGDRTVFELIAQKVFRYQWFGNKAVPLTTDIVDALYECSKGIIDQLICIFMFMNIDYVRAKTKPTVNAEYVYRVAMKHFPGMQKLLAATKREEIERLRAEARMGANEELNRITAEMQAESAKEKTVRVLSDPDSSSLLVLRQRITVSVLNVTDDYSDVVIENAFNDVLKTAAGKKAARDNDERGLTRQVFERLKTNRTESRRKGAKTPKPVPAVINAKLFEEEP